MIALMALVLAVAGGSAYAGTKLAKNSVKAKHIAKNAVTSKHTQNLTVSKVRNVKAFNGIESQAPKVQLVRRGPFRVFARCYTNGVGATGRAYVTVARNGAVGRVGGTVYEGVGIQSYIPKTSIGHQFTSGGTAPQDSAVTGEGAFSAILGRTSTQISVTAFVKGGALAEGNGTYGAGKRCIFHATETGTG